MKDLQLISWMQLECKVLKENQRQIDKWGIQDHAPFEWLGYTTEELGELAKAIGEFEYRGGLVENVVKEAIETATLCLKIAEMFDALLVTKLLEEQKING